MRARLAVSLALAAFAAPPVAHAALLPQPQTPATLVMPDGPARALYQSWIDNSALPVPAGTIPVTVQNCRVDRMACVENGGITFPDVSYLAVYGESGDRDLAAARGTFLHEVAHILDQQRAGRGGYRRMFRKILGRDKVVIMRGGWWRFGFVPDSETFADAYAYCASEPHVMPGDGSFNGYGTYRPTDLRQHEVICHSLSVRLAADYQSSAESHDVR